MQWVIPIKNLKKDMSLENGGKAANLGEMTQNGFNVPGGFCVTGRALDHHIEDNKLMPKILEIIDSMDFDNFNEVEKQSDDVRQLIEKAPIPEDVESQIKEQIQSMKDAEGKDPFVAVRSSVSVRDSDITSFPGMMDTYHFIRGEEEIIRYIMMCWASLYTGRALYRRHQQNIPQTKGVIAPIVQKMVNSDVAGVLFTANPVTSSRDEYVIEANWGLGESLVSGEAIVDYFIVSKGNPPQVKLRKVMDKNIMVTVDKEKGIGRKKYDLEGEMRSKCTLKDEQLLELAELGSKLEKVFQYPQDIEWAYEGGELFLLQSRNVKGLKDVV